MPEQITSEERLINAVEDLLREAESSEGIGLSTEEYAFVVRTVSNFAIRSIFKYLKGAKEHGGNFLVAVDHHKELEAEIMDLLFYASAANESRYKSTYTCLQQSTNDGV